MKLHCAGMESVVAMAGGKYTEYECCQRAFNKRIA
jgi:hypothetical protein